MSYRGVDVHSPNRPLIDLIPDDNLFVEDEDEAFYSKENESIVETEWKAIIQRATIRVLRKHKRFFIIYLIVYFIAWIAWGSYVGPRYARYNQDIREMDAAPEAAYGSNERPEFKDMIHVKTLEEQYLPQENNRLVIVGDVHGCREELEELLQKVDFNEKSDHLILTGDIIAKGPDSPGVVSLAQKLGASCVRGNHEDKVLLSIAQLHTPHAPLPEQIEGVDHASDSLDEQTSLHGDHKLRKLVKQLSKQHISWLRQCPVILRVGQIHKMGEVIVVHAGLVPDIPLERQDPFQCMNMRTIDLKTHLPSETRDGTPWSKFWNHQQKKLPQKERSTVIYGHDAKKGLNLQKYTMGLDSSCVKGGHLTAMVIDSAGKNTIVQVKCKGYVE